MRIPGQQQLHLFIYILLLPALPGFCQPPERPAITGIAFVALQVSDIKKATGFYHAVLGYDLLPVKNRAVVNKQTMLIRVNPRQFITIAAGLPAGQDERLLWIAFETSNAEAMRVYLQSKGVAVPPSLNAEIPGQLSFSIHDPDRHPIQFVQWLTNAKAPVQQALPVNAVSRRILHAGLTIADTQAANKFYVTILGFSEIWRGGANDSVTSWINMRVPEGTDYLEYMLINGPVSRLQLGSLHHIALMVPDMQQVVDALRVRSVNTGYPVAAPRIGRNNRWQLNLFDPDGTRIELMEPFTMR